MSAWTERPAARLYEPLLGRALSGLRARVLECCALSATLADGRSPDYSRSPRVLDCCCGPGGLSRLLRDRGMAVTGVDLSLPMLEVARRRVPDATFLHVDARALPFAAGAYEAAVISLALHAMDAATADVVLSELLRVARVVVIADFCLAERNLEVPAVAVLRAVEWLVGGEHYRNSRRFMEWGGLEGLIHRRGLSVLRRAHALGGGVTVAVVAARDTPSL